ncbi:hypothetical protein Bca4012_028154 [Brassica carinata]
MSWAGLLSQRPKIVEDALADGCFSTLRLQICFLPYLFPSHCGCFDPTWRRNRDVFDHDQSSFLVLDFGFYLRPWSMGERNPFVEGNDGLCMIWSSWLYPLCLRIVIVEYLLLWGR